MNAGRRARRLPIACLLAAMPMLASGASHDIKVFIGEYDLNHDGSVSKEEFADEREHRFIVTDANHDGGLTHEEYVGEYRTRLQGKNPDAKAMERGMKQADVRFGVLDSNKDGRISRAEYAHSGWNMFTNHDYTKDGAISSRDDVEPRSST
jgi:hypothetical protein